ncbi:MAG: hypothetical protein OEY09_05915 [Gammaproteobacteria bacterium]|nr:hypothetical protein [Gammaproteobacteria bacterium]
MPKKKSVLTCILPGINAIWNISDNDHFGVASGFSQYFRFAAAEIVDDSYIVLLAWRLHNRQLQLA